MIGARHYEDQARLERIAKQMEHWYGPGAYYNVRKGRYERFYISPKYKKYVRQQSNRAVRRTYKNLGDDIIPSGHSSFYKKMYDYWWTLF